MKEYIDKMEESRELATKEENQLPADLPHEKTMNDVEEDYTYTKKKLKEIIETTEPVLEHAADLAMEGGEPRQIEVVATLAKSLGDMARAIAENTKMKADIYKQSGKPANPSVNGDMVQHNNTFYVGSMEEFLNEIRKDKDEEEDVYVTLEEEEGDV